MKAMRKAAVGDVRVRSKELVRLGYKTSPTTHG
jgi:hypothetical protein